MNQPQRVAGQALLQKVASLGSASKASKAKACGYVILRPDGSERVCFTAFYEALAMASGVQLEQPSRAGLSYQASVLTTGAILIGPRYVEQLGLEPGDKVRLEVDSSKISLAPT
jgi:hypothetical protein